MDLSFNNIKDGGVKAIASTLSTKKTIRKLHLSGNLITSEGFKYVGQLLLNKSSSLETLYLSCNSGHIDGAVNIANCINRNIALKCLCLNGNKINSKGCAVISNALLLSGNIMHLNLSDNNIGDSGLALLSKSLTSYQLLEVLELSFNGITATGMSTLATALKYYHRLTKLALDNNKLSSDGAALLASIFPSLRLQVLDIGFNEIGPEGLDGFIQSLGENMSFLTSFALSGNVINAETSVLLASWVVKNEVLNHLFLDRTSISPIGQRHIAAAIASNRMSTLETFTGFGLGLALTTLGSPQALLNYSNERILKYLKLCWVTRIQSEFLKKKSNENKSSDSIECIQIERKSEDVELIYNGDNKSNGVSCPDPGVNEGNRTNEVSNDLSNGILEKVKYLSLNKDDSSNKSVDSASMGNGDLVSVGSFDYEYDDILSSKILDVDHIKAAKSISQSPLNIAELWKLHQHFFSPPQDMNDDNVDNGNGITATVDTSSDNQHVSVDKLVDHYNNDFNNFSAPNAISNNDASSSNDSIPHDKNCLQIKTHDKRNRTTSSSIDRPHKRHSNINNMARVSRFSRICEILEDAKRKPTSDKDTLLILRMLQYSENFCRDKREHFTDVDVETLFFRMFEYR